MAGGHGTGSTTALVSGITQTGQNLAYTYDNAGNILSEVRGAYTTSYVYDGLGQLIRENDQRAGQTWTYTYDRGGNILSKSRYAYTTGTLGTALQTNAYTYNADWKDKLASYRGGAITYDAIGNPLTDGRWTYTWHAGRQLATVTMTGIAASFDYNADGLRVRKTVNGTATDYTLHGKRIVHLKKGADNMHFFYDAQGRPAMIDFNGTRYGLIHNLQGDVIAIIDGSGTQAVEYTYNAWGKPLSRTGTLAATLGYLNPFRYRGYTYDEETKFYYLRSRYYSAEWGRFLNADSVLGRQGQLLGHNAFAYCRNNPITRLDKDGYSDLGTAAYYQWEQYASTLAMIDGPLPVGDAVAAAGLVVVAGGFIVDGVVNLFNSIFNRNDAKLPPSSDVSVDIDHIMKGHSASGGKGPNKDKFPPDMDASDVLKATIEAYEAARIIKEQFDNTNGLRYFLEGAFGIRVIQMWFSVPKTTITTAWPK